MTYQEISSLDVPTNKLCQKCGQVKQISEFFKKSSKSTEVRTPCKKCCMAKTSEWKHSNPDSMSMMSHRFYLSHKKNHSDSMAKWRHKIRKNTPWLFCYYGAKQRCINPNTSKFHLYGGKGVKFLLSKRDVEYLWNRDLAFLQNRPSLDRKDSNGNYEISNCRFIELSENSRLGAYSRINSQGHF